MYKTESLRRPAQGNRGFPAQHPPLFIVRHKSLIALEAAIKRDKS